MKLWRSVDDFSKLILVVLPVIPNVNTISLITEPKIKAKVISHRLVTSLMGYKFSKD